MRSSIIGSGQRNRHFLGRWRRKRGFPSAEVDLGAQRRQVPEGVSQVGGAGGFAGRPVQGDDVDVTILERGANEAGEDAFWPHFDKGAHALGVEVFDDRLEAHRRGQLPTQQLGGQQRIVGVGRGRCVGVNRNRSGGQGRLGDFGAKGYPGRFDQRAVEGGRHRKGDGWPAGPAAACLGRGNRGGAAGQDALVGAVVIGQDYIGHFRGQVLQRINGCLDSQHAARVTAASGISHQAAAGHAQGQQGGAVDPAGGVQGGQFAIAVPAGSVRSDVEIGQHRQHGQADRADSRLGHIGALQGLQCLALPIAAAKRAWKQNFPKGRCSRPTAIGLFDGLHGHGEGADQVAPHVGVLTALSGE